MQKGAKEEKLEVSCNANSYAGNTGVELWGGDLLKAAQLLKPSPLPEKNPLSFFITCSLAHIFSSPPSNKPLYLGLQSQTHHKAVLLCPFLDILLAFVFVSDLSVSVCSGTTSL